MKLKKRIFAVLLVMLVTVGALFALAASEYPNAVLVFSGMELTTKKTTVIDPTDLTEKEEISTQAFVDITLKNIRATGVSFCMKYDTSLLQLSDFSTNKEIENTTSTEVSSKYNMEHAYFQQDTTFFPDENTFKDDWGDLYLNVSPVIGVADADKGFLIMNFIPEVDSHDDSAYIAVDEASGEQLILADTEDVCFGKISFRIKSPQEFSALTDAEMADALKIVSFSEADMTHQLVEDSTSNTTFGNEGIQMSYWDPESEQMLWYSDPDRNIDFLMDITARLEKVYADKSELTVSAYDIYKTGEVTDLLDFVNANMSKLILQYADGSFVPAKTEWIEDNLSEPYDPAGGEYTLIQAYGEHEFTITVHVEPVKLVGFVAEKENLTFTQAYVKEFLAQDFTESGLKPLDVLELPTVVTPVLEPYQYTGGLPDISGTFRWQEGADASGEMSALPTGFGDSAATYTFYGVVASATELRGKYEWLTVDDPPPTVAVTRSVVENEADLPKTLTVSATNADGTVKITVAYSSAEDGTAIPIPENTAFFLRMPGGEDIDSTLITSLESHDGYSVTYNADNGTYTIVLEALHTIKDEKQLAEYINLGERAGNFSIAAQEPEGGPITAYADFKVPASTNAYTAAPAAMGTSPNYTFDYSTSYASMFPVKAGTTLPTTVTLPLSGIQVTISEEQSDGSTKDTPVTIPQRIATTYDGTDGSEPGALATFTVESWTTTKDASTGVVTATGLLAETNYTNYGKVSNPDKITVTIKYLETADTDTESVTVETLDDQDNFTYNPRQEGYGNGDLQTATFTVRNTGTAEIHGLSVSIALTDSGYEGFVLCTGVPEILESGASADFDIRTKKGLPVGPHVATVTLYSNNKALDTFTLTFQVVKEPVYNITLIVKEDPSYGTAVTDSGIYTAKEGDRVYMTATPANPDDYVFKGWSATDENLELVQYGDDPLKIYVDMPGEDITITATFEEGVGAHLRVEDLRVTNTENSVDYDLLDASWIPMEFESAIREYRVVVPSDVEHVLLHFTPRAEAQGADTSKVITLNHDGVDEPIDHDGDADNDGTFVSESISLYIDPSSLNTLTLLLSKDDVDRMYTIYIYRKLPQSSLMTFKPGNSPYGLIEKAPNLDAATAKTQFITDGYMFTADNCPEGETPGIVYTPKAWIDNASNYDLEPAALFVDAGQSFADPGYSKVVNSIGEPVTAVTKSVTVNLLAETDTAKQDGSSEEFSYIKSETVALPSSGAISELTGKRIRPDVYKLTYSFTDYDGSTVSVTKPLILLAPPGDVNIDRAADATDTSRILNRFSTDIANADNVADYVTGGLVFKYRVCDVNRDGNLNAIDANWIRAGLVTSFYMNPEEEVEAVI